MSYILDALKKSEQERDSGRGIFNDGAQGTAVQARRAVGYKVIAGVLLLSVLLVMMFYWNAKTGDSGKNLTSQTESTPTLGKNSVRDLSEQMPVTPVRMKSQEFAQSMVAVDGPDSGNSTLGLNSIPFLRSMPPDFQHGLPKLVVNIHVYSADKAQRILYINNRQYREGEYITDDVRVKEIIQDGAVLQHLGKLFKLSRPN